MNILEIKNRDQYDYWMNELGKLAKNRNEATDPLAKDLYAYMITKINESLNEWDEKCRRTNIFAGCPEMGKQR